MSDQRYLKQQRFRAKDGTKRYIHGWSFCMAIPSSLRGHFISNGRKAQPAKPGKDGKPGKPGKPAVPGKPLSKIIIGLGTQSLADAQAARWDLLKEWREKFKRALSGEPLSLAEIEAEALEIYTSSLQRMEADAKRGKYTGVPVLAPDGETIMYSPEAAAINAACEAAGTALENEDWDAASVEIKSIERRKGVEIKAGTDTYKLAAQAILTAQIEAMTGRLRLLDGKPSEAPQSFLGTAGIDPVTLRQIKGAPKPQLRIREDAEGMRFSEAAALYISQTQRDPSAKLTEHTRRQSESVFKLFEKFVDDAPIAAITKSVAVEFLDLVAKLDPRWNHVEDARKLSLAKLVEVCAKRPGPRLSNRTINRYVTTLSSVFKWADKRSDDDIRNPFRGQSLKEGTGTEYVRFDTEELNKLLGSRMMKDTTAAQRIRPNKNTFQTAMLWIPLLALFSGLRSNEVCQLLVPDVIRKDGIWAFRVDNEGENQQVKTEAAIRIVPVHSELIRCGFLDYLKTLPDGQLFPALKPGGADGKLNHYFTTRFIEYRQKCGVTAPRRVFHSFRKNAAQALKDKRATPAEIAELIGHEQGFTLSTYAPLQLPMPALRELIERIEYDGLKLDHLHVA